MFIGRTTGILCLIAWLGCNIRLFPFLVSRLKKSSSNQLSMNFFLVINVKMPTIVGILTFMCRKNSILGLSDPEKKN